MGFSWWLSVISPAIAEEVVWFLGQETPLEKEMATIPVHLPGKSTDKGAWWATVYGVTVRHDLATRHHHLHHQEVSRKTRLFSEYIHGIISKW